MPAAGLAAAALFFAALAMTRLIARDEGYYALAAKLVLQGQRPYLDFFYPQMPLLPYVYALWMKAAGASWTSIRLFSALLAALLTLLLMLETRRLFGNWAALLAALLFAACNFVFPWFVTVQTYSLSTLLLFASYVLLNRSSAALPLLLSGLLFGAAVDARLMFAGLAPVLVLHLVLRAPCLRQGLRTALLFCCGAAAAAAPNAFFILADFDAYMFNNLGYHLNRAAHSMHAEMMHKIVILKVLLGLARSEKFDAFQMPLLILANLAALAAVRGARRPLDPCFLIAAALFALNLTPTPAYVKYFSTLVPFLIVGALYCIPAARALSGTARAGAAAGGLIALLIYLAGVPQDIVRYTKSGKGVIGIMTPANAELWSLRRVREISALIDGKLGAGQTAAVFWPGYLLEARARAYPGLENHFGLDAAARLRPEERPRYRLLSEKGMVEAVRAGKPDAVLIFNLPRKNRVPSDALRTYSLAAEKAPAALYLRKQQGFPDPG